MTALNLNNRLNNHTEAFSSVRESNYHYVRYAFQCAYAPFLIQYIVALLLAYLVQAIFVLYLCQRILRLSADRLDVDFAFALPLDFTL